MFLRVQLGVVDKVTICPGHFSNPIQGVRYRKSTDLQTRKYKNMKYCSTTYCILQLYSWMECQSLDLTREILYLLGPKTQFRKFLYGETRILLLDILIIVHSE